MRAIVIGAASGIGQAVVRRLARDAASTSAPARLLLVDRDGGGGLDAVAAEMAGLGGTGVPLVADLADPLAAEAIGARAAQEVDGLDALVSNAGYAIPRFGPGVARCSRLAGSRNRRTSPT